MIELENRNMAEDRKGSRQMRLWPTFKLAADLYSCAANPSRSKIPI